MSTPADNPHNLTATDFEPLRQMEQFTREMFNRIIAFQEKEHPAWDPQRSFDERIRGLPLHYLVFSPPDRDAKVYGPVVAHYYPLREELQRIAFYSKQVAQDPLVVDLHARNGFIGSLLAREGVRVIGLRDPDTKPNQIPEFYDPSFYERSDKTLAEIDFPFDVAFSSWMPPGVNATPEILKREPKLIVFVHTDHADPESAKPQTGTPEAFTGLPERYKLIDEWSITRPKDLFHAVWPDLTPSIEETRHTKIYADTPYHDIPAPPRQDAVNPYDWEIELGMALLAHQAKEHLNSQGML